MQALLHFVKVRALHRKNIQNRGLGPSSPSHAFLTSDLKLEKITQILDVLLTSQEEEKEGGGEGRVVNCVSEEQRVDMLKDTVVINEKSHALSARIELIDRRLTAVCDDIILASTPASTVLLTPTHDTTILVSHSCPPLPLINRINNENSILFLNKSMNDILDFNEENNDNKNDDKSKSNQQIMKSKIKKEEKNILKNVLLNVPIQRPTLLSLLETTNYFNAEKDFLESNKQWNQLQLQLDTPSGVRKFFIRMRYVHD